MVDDFPPPTAAAASTVANVNEGVLGANDPSVVQGHFVHSVVLRPAAIVAVAVVVGRIGTTCPDGDASLRDFNRSRSMGRNKISIMLSYVRNGHVGV